MTDQTSETTPDGLDMDLVTYWWQRAKAAEARAAAADRVIEQVRALADEAESNPSARYIHPSRLRVALATADADATEGEA